MAEPRIVITGYRETIRAIGAVDRAQKREIQKGLREAAAPIAEDTRRRLTKYNGLSLETIRPRTGVGGVYITQRQGKKTGTRPDFGSLQMVKGFIPAADAGELALAEKVNEQLGALIAREGLG